MNCFLTIFKTIGQEPLTSCQLNDYFESMVEIPRIKVGERQTIETLINEEALLFAKYLRDEIGAWNPRIVD